MQSTVTLADDMAFEVAIDEHRFTIDAKPEHGGHGRGPNPKALALASLAGCTAMDVISMLRKMRQTVTRLDVRAESELTEQHPKVFTGVTITYDVEGDVDAKRLMRAVNLSNETYCGVHAMLEQAVPIDVVVRLNGEVVSG